MKNHKKLHIQTWGCQMNVYDSSRMSDVLTPLGYQACDNASDADMVILNPCHIREKAAEKIYSELGRLRKHKEALAQDGRHMVIAVAGCVAQAEGVEMWSRFENSDLPYYVARFFKTIPISGLFMVFGYFGIRWDKYLGHHK